METERTPETKQAVSTFSFLLSLLHGWTPFSSLPKNSLSWGPVGLLTAEGGFQVSTAAPLEAHSSHKGKAQGLPCALARAGGGALDYTLQRHHSYPLHLCSMYGL